jgi:hypothetical protein
VDLDRPGGHEERLGDLAVGGALRGQLGDAPLAGRERLDAAQRDSSWPRTGGA